MKGILCLDNLERRAKGCFHRDFQKGGSIETFQNENDRLALGRHLENGLARSTRFCIKRCVKHCIDSSQGIRRFLLKHRILFSKKTSTCPRQPLNDAEMATAKYFGKVNPIQDVSIKVLIICCGILENRHMFFLTFRGCIPLHPLRRLAFFYSVRMGAKEIFTRKQWILKREAWIS